MEQNILAASIASRDAFNSLEKLDADNELSPLGRTVYSVVREYYDLDSGATSCDLGLLRERLRGGTPNPKHRDAVLNLLDSVGAEQISAPNIVDAFVTLRKRNLGFEIATALSSGDRNESKVVELMDAYRDVESAVSQGKSEVVNGLSLDVLREKVLGEGRVRIAPSNLQREVGRGLIGGHHVVIFGRPNKGKSALAINQAATCAHDGHRVLYIENEDPLATTITRFICRLTEWDEDRVFGDMPAAMKVAFERGYGNLHFKDMSPGNYREIRAVAEEVKPDVIFLNQIRNFSTPALSRPEQLEYCAIQGRNLAKALDCVVFSITQAGDSGTNKLLLSPEDVEYSKTGVQGAVDLMIGIGTNPEFEQRGQIMLNICKNKLTPKHTGVACRIEPFISRITGIS